MLCIKILWGLKQFRVDALNPSIRLSKNTLAQVFPKTIGITLQVIIKINFHTQVAAAAYRFVEAAAVFAIQFDLELKASGRFAVGDFKDEHFTFDPIAIEACSPQNAAKGGICFIGEDFSAEVHHLKTQHLLVFEQADLGVALVADFPLKTLAGAFVNFVVDRLAVEFLLEVLYRPGFHVFEIGWLEENVFDFGFGVGFFHQYLPINKTDAPEKEGLFAQVVGIVQLDIGQGLAHFHEVDQFVKQLLLQGDGVAAVVGGFEQFPGGGYGVDVFKGEGQVEGQFLGLDLNGVDFEEFAEAGMIEPALVELGLFLEELGVFGEVFDLSAGAVVQQAEEEEAKEQFFHAGLGCGCWVKRR